MQKDLIGAYVEITSLECEERYIASGLVGCVYILKSSGEIKYKYNSKFSIGYAIQETTNSNGNITLTHIAQANSVLIDDQPLSVGDKIVFLFGDFLIEERFINWILTHTKPVLYDNKISRLQYNGKYVRNVNSKSVSKVNSKEILPFYDMPNDAIIKGTYIGATGEKTIKLHLFAYKTPVELYIDDVLVGTYTDRQTSEELSITKTFTNGQEYTFKLVGGQLTYGVFIFNLLEKENNTLFTGVFDLKEAKYGKNGVPSVYFLPSDTIYSNSSVSQLDHKLINNAYIKNLSALCVNFDGTPLEIPKCVKILGNSVFWLEGETKNIIPRTIVVLAQFSGNKQIFGNELQFNHLENDILFLEIRKLKAAQAITIYHYGNPTVLNYDWAAANYTPTFVDLRG